MRKLALLTSLCVVLIVPGAFAHHPFAADFDSAKPVTVTGTVESFEWTNPHSSIPSTAAMRAERRATGPSKWGA
jgi:hypothetical protein